MKINYRAKSSFGCQACQNYDLAEDDEECMLCGYTAKVVRDWIKERQLVNKLIEMYNNGEIKNIQ